MILSLPREGRTCRAIRIVTCTPQKHLIVTVLRIYCSFSPSRCGSSTRHPRPQHHNNLHHFLSTRPHGQFHQVEPGSLQAAKAKVQTDPSYDGLSQLDEVLSRLRVLHHQAQSSLLKPSDAAPGHCFHLRSSALRGRTTPLLVTRRDRGGAWSSSSLLLLLCFRYFYSLSPG